MTLYTKEKDVLSLHVSQRVAELRKQASFSIQRWIYMLLHVFSLSVITFCANFKPFIYITLHNLHLFYHGKYIRFDNLLIKS